MYKGNAPRLISRKPYPFLLLIRDSVTRSDQYVATAGNQDGSALGTLTSSIWYFAMRIRQWLAKRRRRPQLRRQGVIQGARARIFPQICKLHPCDWTSPHPATSLLPTSIVKRYSSPDRFISGLGTTASLDVLLTGCCA